jgi:hypothetical protein
MSSEIMFRTLDIFNILITNTIFSGKVLCLIDLTHYLETMVVFFQSQPVLDDEDLKSIQSYDELLETLEVITSIPSLNIKLVASGKMLSHTSYSLETNSSKIIMYV